MDSGLTIGIFKDEHLVENIREAKQKLMLYKSVGHTIINKEANAPGVGRIYVGENQITNV